MLALIPASSHGRAYSLIDPQNSPAAPFSPPPTPPNINHVLCHPLSFLCLDRFQSGIHLLTKTPATATWVSPAFNLTNQPHTQSHVTPVSHILSALKQYLDLHSLTQRYWHMVIWYWHMVIWYWHMVIWYWHMVIW